MKKNLFVYNNKNSTNKTFVDLLKDSFLEKFKTFTDVSINGHLILNKDIHIASYSHNSTFMDLQELIHKNKPIEVSIEFV